VCCSVFQNIAETTYGSSSDHRIQLIESNVLRIGCTPRYMSKQIPYASLCECVAVRCRVLQCFTACFCVEESVAVCCSVLQHIYVCLEVSIFLETVSASVLQCVTLCEGECCSVLQRDAAFCSVFIYVSKGLHFHRFSIRKCVAVCCSVFQCVAVCCSVLNYVGERCSVSQRVAACFYVCLGSQFSRTPSPPKKFLECTPGLFSHSHLWALFSKEPSEFCGSFRKPTPPLLRAHSAKKPKRI